MIFSVGSQFREVGLVSCNCRTLFGVVRSKVNQSPVYPDIHLKLAFRGCVNIAAVFAPLGYPCDFGVQLVVGAAKKIVLQRIAMYDGSEDLLKCRPRRALSNGM